MGVELLVILTLVLANGVLAGAEIAVISLRPGRLKELIEKGSHSARALKSLRDLPERFFATVQIGITVISAFAGAFGGATLAEPLAETFQAMGAAASWASKLALGLVVGVLSYLSLVLGELVPKSLGLKFSEKYALFVARPLLVLSRVLKPLVWLLTKSSNFMLWPFKDKTNFVESRMSADELVELIDEAKDAGMVSKEATEIASRALELPQLVASDVMVPRTAVVSLQRNASRETLRQVLLEQSHSRYPVVDGHIDQVIGYVSTKDILAMAWDESLFVLEDLIRPPFFVPPTKNAVELMAEMRQRRVPFSVVVDEHGGMAGIVTLEDVLEELVGEILSEHARRPVPVFTPAHDGTFTVPGTTPIRELNRELDLKLPEGVWVTVAGLCLSLANRIPVAGDRFRVNGGPELEVIAATPRQIQTVRLHLPPATDSSSASGQG
jgi:putative hemolysin